MDWKGKVVVNLSCRNFSILFCFCFFLFKYDKTLSEWILRKEIDSLSVSAFSTMVVALSGSRRVGGWLCHPTGLHHFRWKHLLSRRAT